MFRLFPRPGCQYIAADGRVGCPMRRRDVDVDVCLACEWIDDVETTRAVAIVRCDPPRSRLDGDYAS